MQFQPQVQAELDQLAIEMGLSVDDLANELMADCLHKRAEVRKTIDRRFEDIESGRVTLIPGDQVRAMMREQSEAYRAKHGG